MRPDEVPDSMLEAARAAMRQANAYGLQQQWAAALGVWLEVAQQYPHVSSPLLAMLKLYLGAAEAQGVGYPRLAPPEQASTPSLASQAALWETVQQRMFARLEQMAQCRGIRLRGRRHLRTGGYLLRSLLLWWPWLGPSSNGVYAHTFLPSHLPPRSGTASRSRTRWIWPGRVVYLNQHLTYWAPDMLAHLLSQHMLVCQVLRQRHAAAVAASAQIVAIPMPQRLRLLGRLIGEGRDLSTPADALITPEGRAWVNQFRTVLMLRVLRQELQHMGML